MSVNPSDIASQVQTITANDLLRMPDDGFRYELVKGELRKMAPAGHTHGRIAARLTWQLAQYVEAHKLGAVYAAETGFLLSSHPDTVRAPNVAFVSRARIETAGDVEGYWPGAPDLAIEVVSPSDTYVKVEEKVIEWLEAGTRMVLVVNPRNRTVTVHRALTDITMLTEQDTLAGGDILPGWSIKVDTLFS
jgi:Uma2 family endonuclease